MTKLRNYTSQLHYIDLWPHPCPSPWILFLKFWNNHIARIGGLIGMERKICDLTKHDHDPDLWVTTVGLVDVPDSDWGDSRCWHAVDISSFTFSLCIIDASMDCGVRNMARNGKVKRDGDRYAASLGWYSTPFSWHSLHWFIYDGRTWSGEKCISCAYVLNPAIWNCSILLQCIFLFNLHLLYALSVILSYGMLKNIFLSGNLSNHLPASCLQTEDFGKITEGVSAGNLVA